MIEPGTSCKLVTTPPNSTLWDQYKGKELKATEKVGVNGAQQFTVDGAKAIYANGNTGFVVEPV